MDGIVIIDKETGLFSRRIGTRVARMFGTKKFGHIGTLDEMATGVLPIVIGNATKMIPFIEENTENKKTYLFGLKFGFETDSLDILGNTIKESNVVPGDIEIKDACVKIAESTEQIPPIYSAIHINGQRAYDLARHGKNVEIPARPVKIYELEYTGKTGDEYNFRVTCSRGTYVRAIVRDIAKFCDTLATTTYIRRTFTNGFDIKNAVRLDFLENLVNNNERIDEYLMQPDCALGDIPVINLGDKDVEFYKNGGFIKTDFGDGQYRVYSNKTFIGIGRVVDGMLKPKRTL